MQINVQGGTNAGWRVTRAARSDYTCSGCNKPVKHYWSACPGCGTKPEEA